MTMKKSETPNKKSRFLGALAGLVIAVLVLEFAGLPLNHWIRVGLFAASAWAGMMIAGLLASRR